MTADSQAPEPLTPTAPSSPRPYRRRAALLLGLAAVAAGLVVVFGPRLGPAPPLAPALRLAAAGKYEEADARLTEILAHDPSQPEARVALAEVMLYRPDGEPSARATRALALLDGLHLPRADRRAAAFVLRGKAHDALHQVGRAEAAYSSALRADPNVGEAGWLLLQTYYIEGRNDEARRLALRLARNEPDPRDRVRLLLEPCRPDVLPLSSAGIITSLEKARVAEPDDRPSALAYFRALAGDGQSIDRAVAGLRAFVGRYPDDLDGWDTLLDALGAIGQHDEMATALGRVPRPLAENPRIVRHRGRLELERREYAPAIADLSAVVAARPSDVKSIHRLADALKYAGKAEQAEEARRREADYEAARIALRGIKGTKDSPGVVGAYQKAEAQPNLGLVPDPPLYREIAALRERMGHPDEAIAWYRLALDAAPDDATSREAVDRLVKAHPRAAE